VTRYRNRRIQHHRPICTDWHVLWFDHRRLGDIVGWLQKHTDGPVLWYWDGGSCWVSLESAEDAAWLAYNVGLGPLPTGGRRLRQVWFGQRLVDEFPGYDFEVREDAIFVTRSGGDAHAYVYVPLARLHSPDSFLSEITIGRLRRAVETLPW